MYFVVSEEGVISGASGSLIHLLEDKECLAAENDLLRENISRITRYLLCHSMHCALICLAPDNYSNCTVVSERVYGTRDGS